MYKVILERDEFLCFMRNFNNNLEDQKLNFKTDGSLRKLSSSLKYFEDTEFVGHHFFFFF